MAGGMACPFRNLMLKILLIFNLSREYGARVFGLHELDKHHYDCCNL